MTDRTGYHHGDLRNALIAAGLQATRERGADGLAMRDVARQLGVSPNAAYRHFADRDALLSAIADRLRGHMAERMRTLLPDSPARDTAVGHLRAVGLGYIAFALDAPGWFDLAFSHIEASPRSLDEGGMPPPLALLVEALDLLVDAGDLSPTERVGAEWPCWSTVHGFAELALTGPLRGAPRDEVWAAAERAVDTVIAGLVGRRA